MMIHLSGFLFRLKPIQRLGETYSMSRIREPQGLNIFQSDFLRSFVEHSYQSVMPAALKYVKEFVSNVQFKWKANLCRKAASTVYGNYSFTLQFYCTVSKVLFYPVIFIINQQDICCLLCHIDLCWWISHGSSLYQWLMSHFLHSPFPWIFRTSNAPHHKDTSSWNTPMYNITDSYFQKHCIKAVIDCFYDASNDTNLKVLWSN